MVGIRPPVQGPTIGRFRILFLRKSGVPQLQRPGSSTRNAGNEIVRPKESNIREVDQL